MSPSCFFQVSILPVTVHWSVILAPEHKIGLPPTTKSSTATVIINEIVKQLHFFCNYYLKWKLHCITQELIQASWIDTALFFFTLSSVALVDFPQILNSFVR